MVKRQSIPRTCPELSHQLPRLDQDDTPMRTTVCQARNTSTNKDVAAAGEPESRTLSWTCNYVRTECPGVELRKPLAAHELSHKLELVQHCDFALYKPMHQPGTTGLIITLLVVYIMKESCSAGDP